MQRYKALMIVVLALVFCVSSAMGQPAEISEHQWSIPIFPFTLFKSHVRYEYFPSRAEFENDVRRTEERGQCLKDADSYCLKTTKKGVEVKPDFGGIPLGGFGVSRGETRTIRPHDVSVGGGRY